MIKLSKLKLALVATGIVAFAADAWAATVNNVKYIDAAGQEQTCAEATVVAASNSRVTWSAGWYVVTNEVTVKGGAACSGAVHLILADTGKLTISGVAYDNAGIQVSGADDALEIYGQSAGTGALYVTGGDDGAGIGGGYDNDGSNITINGGVVTANGGEDGAGIGGGACGDGLNITINGGVVTAIGDEDGAGIGGGDCGDGSNIYAADDVIVKAGASANPTDEIKHTGTQDIASNLAGKRYVTTKVALASPISNANWAKYKRSRGEEWTKPEGAKDTDPVVNVSKTEIERFCAWLGGNNRLPTVKELTEIFGGNLEREVSEWTSDIDPNSGWCRILGGNKAAIDYTWCREYDKPAMESPDASADYLGFRVIDAADPIPGVTVMDRALAKLAEIENPAEVYRWSAKDNKLMDISDEWTKPTTTDKKTYGAPVIFTGKGPLVYRVHREVSFDGGLAAPNATSLDISHNLDLGAVTKPVTIKGELRGGAADAWRFYLKADELTLNNVLYRGQVFNAVTDSRAINLAGTNDFSGAVMSVGIDGLLTDPKENFVTNLVAEQEAMLYLKQLHFTTNGVDAKVIGEKSAGFTVGKNVTLVTAEDVLFGIKGATLTVDGTLEAAGVNIAEDIPGLLPQTATLNGAGMVKTTHFGMYAASTQYVGVATLVLQSAVPYRGYGDPASSCNVKKLEGASMKVDHARLISIDARNIPTVADTTWHGEAQDEQRTASFVDPLDGRIYLPKSVSGAELVYVIDDEKAAEGYCFTNGLTTIAFPLQKIIGTRVSAWLPYASKADITAATKAGKPTLKLGVVAQRYPWNGIVDVNYKATSWPAEGVFGAVEITANDLVYTNNLDIYSTGKGKTGVPSHAIDLKGLFGEMKGGAQFKALVSDKPIGFAAVKRLAAGEFPAENADKACTFRSMDTVTSPDESQVSPYAEWKVDLVLCAEEDIDVGTISLAGLLSTGWTSIQTPAKLAAGKEVAVVTDWLKQVPPYSANAGLPPSWHWCSKTIKEFTCGVKNLSPDNTGKKLKVTMRLTSHEDKTKTLDVATIETVLVAPAQ